MPRKSRIDAPGALHHIIARGIDRKNIFKDNKDRDSFLELVRSIHSNFLRAGLVNDLRSLDKYR
jgi:putative transposase